MTTTLINCRLQRKTREPDLIPGARCCPSPDLTKKKNTRANKAALLLLLLSSAYNDRPVSAAGTSPVSSNGASAETLNSGTERERALS